MVDTYHETIDRATMTPIRTLYTIIRIELGFFDSYSSFYDIIAIEFLIPTESIQNIE